MPSARVDVHPRTHAERLLLGLLVVRIADGQRTGEYQMRRQAAVLVRVVVGAPGPIMSRLRA